MYSSDLSSNFLILSLVTILLGMRHGFDPDHLAAIDGMTRYNARTRPRLARLAGVLFSLGHGAVVLTVALIVTTVSYQFSIPEWLGSVGVWASIVVLILLALVNINSVIRTPKHEMVSLMGWRAGFLKRLFEAGNPTMIVGVGAIFALFFDTFTIASLLAFAAIKYQGWQSAVYLALLFILGMIFTDGINGWFISMLVQRSDRIARVTSRILALTISGVSLFIAALGIASELSPQVATWSDGKETWFGLGVVIIIVCSFLIGQRMAQKTSEKAIRS